MPMKADGSQQADCFWHGWTDPRFEEMEGEDYHASMASQCSSLIQSVTQIMADQNIGINAVGEPWLRDEIWNVSLMQTNVNQLHFFGNERKIVVENVSSFKEMWIKHRNRLKIATVSQSRRKQFKWATEGFMFMCMCTTCNQGVIVDLCKPQAQTRLRSFFCLEEEAAAPAPANLAIKNWGNWM